MKFVKPILLAGVLSLSSFVSAKPIEYKFDIEGAHAFVQFRAKHLGISWLYGRFNSFDGSFVYDPENDANNSVNATIDVNSLDSNHAERDNHLRGEKFLNVDKFKTAKFVSKKYETVGENKATLTGDFTLMGVTKEIVLDVDVMGHGVAPWEKNQGLERQGFEGTVTIDPADYGMKTKWVGDVELTLSLEGIGKP